MTATLTRVERARTTHREATQTANETLAAYNRAVVAAGHAFRLYRKAGTPALRAVRYDQWHHERERAEALKPKTDTAIARCRQTRANVKRQLTMAGAS